MDEVANGPGILERARSHDPAISAVAVFDLDADALYAVGDMDGSCIHADSVEAFRLARSTT